MTKASPLRVLVVEDSREDAALVARTLRQVDPGATVRRVGDEWQMRAALAEGGWDVIVSDFVLPSFTGLDALRLAQESDRDVPFILVSGIVGEEAAVAAMRAGASDFLSKANVARLAPVVERELRERAARAAVRAAAAGAPGEDAAGAVQALAARTADLEAAARELEDLERTLSHDLRAPLRAIQGFGQALLEDCGDRLGDDGRSYAGFVVDGARRMNRMLDGLLDLSRLARAEVHPAPVCLSETAEAVARGLEAAAGRAVEVTIQPDVWADADPRLARALLEILFDNAFKFTARHVSARVELGLTGRAETPTAYVRDDGAGFDMARAGRLFGAFQRLHPEDEFEGAGLGLARATRIVRRHGGRIWAEAEPERGATVFFTLPGLRAGGRPGG